MLRHEWGVVFLMGLVGCATCVPASVRTLDVAHQQAVHVRSHKTSAEVTLWQRQGNAWSKTYPTVSAVIGRNGLAPAGEKKEGDGRTPSGIYDLKKAFGYFVDVTTGLDYEIVHADDIWVDDAASPDYNRWVKAPTQAASFEQLKRADHLYELAAVIEYNTKPVTPGAGSAIFMHIWRRYDHPTAGCVALSERHLRRILKYLDKNKQPVIVLEEGHG